MLYWKRRYISNYIKGLEKSISNIYIFKDLVLKARDLDQDLALKKLYYRPKGHCRTAEEMQEVCKKAGYEFTLAEVEDWLNKQALHQIYKPPPEFGAMITEIKI